MRYPEAAPHYLGPVDVVVPYVRTRLGPWHPPVLNDKSGVRVRHRGAPTRQDGRRHFTIVSIGLVSWVRSYRRSNSSCQRHEGFYAVLGYLSFFFFRTGTNGPCAQSEHRSGHARQVGKFEKPEQGNADPDANHKCYTRPKLTGGEVANHGKIRHRAVIVM